MWHIFRQNNLKLNDWETLYAIYRFPSVDNATMQFQISNNTVTLEIYNLSEWLKELEFAE